MTPPKTPGVKQPCFSFCPYDGKVPRLDTMTSWERRLAGGPDQGRPQVLIASCSNKYKGGDFDWSGGCCCREAWSERSVCGRRDPTEVSPWLARPVFIPPSPVR